MKACVSCYERDPKHAAQSIWIDLVQSRQVVYQLLLRRAPVEVLDFINSDEDIFILTGISNRSLALFMLPRMVRGGGGIIRENDLSQVRRFLGDVYGL